MVAANWKIVKVADIGAKDKSACVTGPFGSSIGKKYWVDEGVPVIRGNNLSIKGQKFIDDDFVFISEEYAEELSRYSAIADDIIFTAAGTLGQVGIIPYKTKYPRYIISNKQMRLRVDKKKVVPLFAFYWFRSPIVQDLVIRQNTGSSVPLINLGILRSLPFPLPPFPIQRRIAEILGALDDKIECNRRINQTLEQMAQALYNHWFINFPSTNILSIMDLIEINPTIHIPKGKRIPYVNMKTLPTDSMSITQISDRLYSSGSKFENGDTLFARITPCLENGKTAFVDFLEEDETGFGSTEFIVLRAKKGVSPQFVYCCARDENLRALAIKSMTGTSGRQRVDPDCFNNFHIKKFSEKNMEVFHKFTDFWFKQIRTNIKENQTLARTRDYLLPKLLSGEIKVEAAEQQVAEVL